MSISAKLVAFSFGFALCASSAAFAQSDPPAVVIGPVTWVADDIGETDGLGCAVITLGGAPNNMATSYALYPIGNATVDNDLGTARAALVAALITPTAHVEAAVTTTTLACDSSNPGRIYKVVGRLAFWP